MQASFFGVSPSRTADLNVYHDESGSDIDHSRYLLQGALFVPKARWQEALDCLNLARAGYNGRIHFVDLRDNSRSKKGEVVWNWIDSYFAKLSYYCPYKCMVADTAAKSEKINRFEKPYHLYNYTAMLAIRSAIPWSFKDYDQIRLQIYSEKMDRAEEDNFTSYLPKEIARRVSTKHQGRPKNPTLLEPIENVHLIPGDPHTAKPEDIGHCEFLQMTDILTSAVAQAINASAIQAIKIDIAEFMASWVEDTRLPPWSQDHGLHRRFSVSCFPDAAGGFFDIPLSIKSKGQMELF